MSEVKEGTLLWSPDQKQIENAAVTKYKNWIEENYKQSFSNQAELWQWSVDELSDFWESVWTYFDVQSETPYKQVLKEETMPGATWFEGSTLNYAEHVFRNKNNHKPAILFRSENVEKREVSWVELEDKTARLAGHLRRLGVKQGDRVVAYMPNVPETVVGLLATASIGAIWSVCSPDFGTDSVLERFTQIRPKVLIACDGYQYNGKIYNRMDKLAQIQAALPTLEETIIFENLGVAIEGLDEEKTLRWDQAIEAEAAPKYEQVPFDQPLWVLFSSGTTGKPKPIVQGQGGILLEQLKILGIEHGVTVEDTYFWYSATGWMMWNFLVGNLQLGATVVLYDGSPGYPNLDAMWQLLEDFKVTFFGTSAAFITSCMNAEVAPQKISDFKHLRGLGSTGSPLTINAFAWIYRAIKADLWVVSTSGGTDLCTAFVGGVPTLPVHAGEIQTRSLGASVYSYNEAGEAVTDEVGELVITKPMPSMPLYFWGDQDNSRYLGSYFEEYEGVWRHGDWIKIDGKGSCVIYGRSDSTINRQGVRLGMSEIYRVIDAQKEIKDSLVIDLELLGRESYMPLFVVLNDGEKLTEELVRRLKGVVRTEVSPRFAPNDIFEIKAIPRTLSGKKMEIPIRKILLGFDKDKVVNTGAMQNPESLEYFVDFAKKLNTKA